MVPVDESSLPDRQSSSHVSPVEVVKLDEVVVNIDEAENDGSEDTDAEKCKDNKDLLVVDIIPERRKHSFYAALDIFAECASFMQVKCVNIFNEIIFKTYGRLRFRCFDLLNSRINC